MTFLLAILIWVLAGAVVSGIVRFVRWTRSIDRRLHEHQRRLSDREVADRLRPQNGRVTVIPITCPVEDDDATV